MDDMRTPVDRDILIEPITYVREGDKYPEENHLIRNSNTLAPEAINP